jgi:hypothetical protein
MPPLDNAKHERFAQALAAGKHAVDAYEVAGYRRNRGHASTLRKDPKLLKRVGLTKTAVMDMLLADRELARKNGQSSAAIRATELLGIELGMFTTRSNNKHSLSGEKHYSQLPPEERRAFLTDLLTRAREVIDRHRTIDAEAQEADRPASDGASNPKPA